MSSIQVKEQLNTMERKVFRESPDIERLAKAVFVENDSLNPVIISGNFSVGGATTPLISNLDIPLVNNEVEFILQNNLNQIIIRSRVSATIKYSFVSGESGTNYFTIKSGTVLFLDALTFNSKKIYFQSDTTTIIEILELYT